MAKKQKWTDGEIILFSLLLGMFISGLLYLVSKHPIFIIFGIAFLVFAVMIKIKLWLDKKDLKKRRRK